MRPARGACSVSAPREAPTLRRYRGRGTDTSECDRLLPYLCRVFVTCLGVSVDGMGRDALASVGADEFNPLTGTRITSASFRRIPSASASACQPHGEPTDSFDG